MEEYCQKYYYNFKNYCDGHSTDGVIENFCRSYLLKCSQPEKKEPTFTTPKPANSATPSFEQIKAYCNLYKNNYWNLCINPQKIRDDAQRFCRAYNNVCPGSPDPGSVFSASQSGFKTNDVQPTGSVEKSVVNGTQTLANENQTRNKNPTWNEEPKKLDQSKEDFSTGKQQSPISFPLNGNIGGMLGVPSGGNGPLAGLGSLNGGNVPHYGGPVKGGIGLGQSIFAPFFGANKGFNVIPTKSYTQGQSYNFAGMTAGVNSGVDWSGTPGLSALNQGLGLGDTTSGIVSAIPGIGRKKRK